MKLFNWYLKPKKIEANGKLYEKLGVQIFKKITPIEILNRLRSKKIKILKKLNVNGLEKYFRDTIAGEIAHLISFIFLVVINVYMIAENLYLYSIILFILNIIVNLYPIFLMRYNRFIIARVLKKSVIELINKK